MIHFQDHQDSKMPKKCVPRQMAGEEEEEEKKEEGEGETKVAEQEPQLKEPPQYAVVLHNDDYTTMEFVIEVLQRFFKKNLEQAQSIMWTIHYEGKGVAGIYSYEIAETKAAQVMELAKNREYPLRATIEAVEP